MTPRIVSLTLAEITTTDNRATGRLRRILGIGFDLAVIIGATIGIGILRTPGLVAGQLHASGTILLVWIAGGLFSLLSAICLTELGTMIPQAGGFYVYARRAFGDWVWFAIGWNDWIQALATSKLPAADAAQVIVGERGRQIITVLSILSLLPLLNAIMMIGTRILFALGRDRLFWWRAAGVNPRGTPGVATLVTTLVGIALIATGTFERLIAMTTVFLALNYAVCCLALVALRRREPASVRPFRAWGYPWSAAIVVAGAFALLGGALIADTISALKAAGLLAIGLVGHAVHRSVRPGSPVT
jgi:amino acid transporter